MADRIIETLTFHDLETTTTFYAGRVWIQEKNIYDELIDEVEVIYFSPLALLDMANYVSNVN